jgi:transcriptional regulator with XRE-family HTH domain
MSEKSTQELEKILGSTHSKNFEEFYNNHKDSLIDEDDAFCVYIKELIKARGLTQQNVFLKADIPERYGYKILSGEKHTRQRDIILRICYAADFTTEETQKTLKKYKMPQLYSKIPRDALLMIIFNEKPGSIIDVNGLLKKNGFDPLRTSGLQD